MTPTNHAPSSAPCPSCQSVLQLAAGTENRAFLCAHCGTQFRLGGRWPADRPSRKAIASFVLGLMSVIGLFITGILALILGLLALDDIRRAPHSIGGKGIAVAGTILGTLFSLTLFLIPVAISFIDFDGLSGGNNSGSGTRVNAPAPSIPPHAIAIAEPGGTWKWLHSLDGTDSTDVNATFHTTDYDDSEWQSGQESPGIHGFGYGEQVAVDIGTPPEGSRHTAYFRHHFSTLQHYASLTLTLYCDDGVVVYLNGNEVNRENLPDGPLSHTTRASEAIGGDNETTEIELRIDAPLESGEHVLAIALHNVSPSSSDLLIGNIRLYGIP